ncbi:MAG: hypothetical protein IJU49_06140, partial [Lachnospiraceae bacterium]|nr:hypothetical protein [Lachnospiraceae bacterium]
GDGRYVTMIYQALIEYKGEQAIVDLPDNKYYLGNTLKELGCPPRTPLYLRDEEDEDLRIKLIAGTELGGKLSLLFHENDTLLTANAVAAALEKTHPAVKAELESAILENRYDTPADLYRDRTEKLRSYGHVRETLYFPLSAQIDLHDDEDGETFEAHPRLISAHENEIREALQLEQAPEYGDMADYYDGIPSAKAKLVSAYWDVEEYDGLLYGKVDLYLTAPLTPEEKESVTDWVTGQNSDGLGEGFDQRPIATEYGDLYVSMYDMRDSWICDAEEFEDLISQSQGPVMGGM